MVKRRNEYPEPGELVVGTVKNTNPNSAFIDLDGYEHDGMIHISEIARKWVREIEDFIKEGDTVVCLVMEIDRDKGHITLSRKRVKDRQKNQRLQRWKRDEKGERLLRKLAEAEGVSLDEAYDEIGYDIQDSFKDMLEGFETVLEDRGILERKGFEEEWIDSMEEIAEENLELREEEVKGILEARLYGPDAVDQLKEIFGDVSEEYGVEVSYISAPEYSIVYSTTDLKEGDRVIREAAEEAIDEIESAGGEGSFRVDRD